MGSVFTIPLIPRAAVRPRPLQHFQVPARSGAVTHPRAPWTVVLPRPLQHRQVPVQSGASTRLPIPRAPVRLGPSQPLVGYQKVHELENPQWGNGLSARREADLHCNVCERPSVNSSKSKCPFAPAPPDLRSRVDGAHIVTSQSATTAAFGGAVVARSEPRIVFTYDVIHILDYSNEPVEWR